jgi:ABC-type multidrug transport system fused ATPase/permease subunit
MKGRTVFLIAHRLRSAIRADQIVVLDHGRIVETGTHEELLRQRGTYAHLFKQQAHGLAIESDAQSSGYPSNAALIF